MPKIVRFLGEVLVIKPLTGLAILLGYIVFGSAFVISLLTVITGLGLILGLIFCTITFLQYVPETFGELMAMGIIFFTYLYVGMIALIILYELVISCKKGLMKSYNEVYNA